MAQRSIAEHRFLVTGASSGIGRELSLGLAAKGARLVLLARNAERLQHLADEIEAVSAARPAIVCGDVTSAEVRQRALDVAQEAWGGLDGLINNAGVAEFERFTEGDAEQRRRIMEVNFLAAVDLTAAAITMLSQGEQPIVVNLGSILGHRAIPRMSAYCASKFALRGWSESIRVELRAVGIDVLLVSPGSTETPFYDNALSGSEKVPWKQSTAVPASRVAAATIRAIERGKREVIPSLPGRWLVRASRCFPRLLDSILKKYA